MSHTFHIVDVFAERPFTGNQLAVVLNADDLSTAEMGHIAQEMNFSETTFVGSTPDEDGGYRVRIFTPSQEISFAGHGVREDPATGNGAAFLGAYLLAHSYFPESNLSLRIEQGYEINRP